MERTLLMLKPHAVQRGIVGQVLERFERMGLRFVEIQSVRRSKDLWEKFYPSDEDWLRNVGSKTIEDCAARQIDLRSRLGTDDPISIGRLVKGWLVDHMSSGMAVAIVLEGNEVQTKVRAVCGATLPNRAAPGTIRFDYSVDSPSLANDERRPVFNLVHASDPSEKRDGKPAAEFEIGILFPQLHDG